MNRMKSGKSKISGHKDSLVLIYSSDDDFLNYYRSMFVSLGLTPITETTAEAALGMLRLTVVEFVVLDQDEERQGYEQVIRHAREAEYHPTVVGVSRKHHQNSHPEASGLEAAEHLGHPAPQEDLLDALFLECA